MQLEQENQFHAQQLGLSRYRSAEVERNLKSLIPIAWVGPCRVRPRQRLGEFEGRRLIDNLPTSVHRCPAPRSFSLPMRSGDVNYMDGIVVAPRFAERDPALLHGEDRDKRSRH